MKNIFENTYFGKPYMTRSGEKALYSHYDDNYNLHKLFTYSQFVWVDNEGFVDEEHLELNDPNDIVSEWHEKINEVKLNKLAEEEIKRWCDNIKDSSYDFWRECYECFKAGYRKAKQE